MQERSSCSVSSASHQFCTLWLQLTPSTWHAGCRIVQRPFRWLAEEQSRLWNRLLRASAIGPGHLLAVGTKDQAVGRLRATSAELGSITAFLRPYSAENTTYPQSIFLTSDFSASVRIPLISQAQSRRPLRRTTGASHGRPQGRHAACPSRLRCACTAPPRGAFAGHGYEVLEASGE